ncbi:hypothetical protein CBS101457_005436 [Exobasidium rhododendri]|nr:hypothetical protein CBS101457_005436 [Exobasidium rhododendri]
MKTSNASSLVALAAVALCSTSTFAAPVVAPPANVPTPGSISGSGPGASGPAPGFGPGPGPSGPPGPHSASGLGPDFGPGPAPSFGNGPAQGPGADPSASFAPGAGPGPGHGPGLGHGPGSMQGSMPDPVPGPFSGKVPSTNASTATPEDLAIVEGIKHGIKEGLQNALSEALGITVDHELVRDEEVEQAMTCVGPQVTDIIIGCIKKENLSLHGSGDLANQEAHTESIQQCIPPTALEHVSYCVGKLEIQRLGEDAHILQQLYQSATLKEKEKVFENPTGSSNKANQSELKTDTAPLFNQGWYDTHKDRAPMSNDNDLLKEENFMPPPPPPPPMAPFVPLPNGGKPTNSTAIPPPPKGAHALPPPPPEEDDSEYLDEDFKDPPAEGSKMPIPKDGGKGPAPMDGNKGPVPAPTPLDGSKKDDKKDIKKDDPSAVGAGKTPGGATDAPFVKRKYGYGPDWATALGVRDRHPLPRRRDLNEEGGQSEMGTLLVGQEGEREGIDKIADEDKEHLGPRVLVGITPLFYARL